MLLLKFILALLPIIWLIAALSGLKMAGYKACLIALPASMLASVCSYFLCKWLGTVCK